MKLLSTTLRTLAFCAGAAFATFPAHAGPDEGGAGTPLGPLHLADKGEEWRNLWMPQAGANVMNDSVSGDQQMAEIVAAYTRSMLDSGGWVNTLMSNSIYTAAHPLMTVAVGSGATSPADISAEAVSL